MNVWHHPEGQSPQPILLGSRFRVGCPPARVEMHVYEVHPRKDHRGVDLISDALPFGRLWYGGPNAITNATGYAMNDSRSADAIIRVYDNAGNLIETHEHAGDFKQW
jgi:hypothetical protein